MVCLKNFKHQVMAQNNSSVVLKNQKLTITGAGAAKATVNGQTITIDVAERVH